MKSPSHVRTVEQQIRGERTIKEREQPSEVGINRGATAGYSEETHVWGNMASRTSRFRTWDLPEDSVVMCAMYSPCASFTQIHWYPTNYIQLLKFGTCISQKDSSACHLARHMAHMKWLVKAPFNRGGAVVACSSIVHQYPDTEKKIVSPGYSASWACWSTNVHWFCSVFL